jgi:hypothetical protein
MWLVVCLGLAGPVAVAEQTQTPATNEVLRSFVRFESIGRGEGRVDTAVTTYRREDGVKVALVAAVHVGDRSYYEELQRLFEDYDALLYEMIRDGDQLAVERVDTSNPLSQFQLGMKSMLGLEFQLEAMDYGRSNFVHADLDPETFFRLQEERGETILGLMVRAMLEEHSRQANNPQGAMSGFQLLAALLSPDRAHALKLVLGQQMDQMEAAMAGIDQGPGGQGSVLVSGRNEHAMRVLEEQIRKGKRRLGIFYGAGHMPDLERRLTALGFEKVDHRWLTAWDIRRGSKKGVIGEGLEGRRD